MSAIIPKRNVIFKFTVAICVCLLFLWMVYSPSSAPKSISNKLRKDVSSMDQTGDTKCPATKDGLPTTKYAVMIDAGSSGSRVHVYKFKVCDDPVLQDEVFRMLKPGLSYYKDDADAAAKSLKKLLDTAVNSVPEELRACTPIAVKATAGLRMLGKKQSDNILASVREYVESYPFPIAGGESGVEIMEGRDEGVYAWITVNYLLGKLKKTRRGESAAIFDLGGGSTQIVFEPKFDIPSESMFDGDHKYELEYQNNKYGLYQHSYLGYGLNEARKKIKAEVVTAWKSQVKASGKAYHPCLPAKHEETITVDDEEYTLIGTGAEAYECRAIVERVFNKDETCEMAPCAFNGIYQPPLSETFRSNDLYVFSYFFDLTQPLGMPLEFSVRELGELTDRVCKGDTRPFQHIPGAIALLEKETDYCLDLSYIYNLLRFGYDIPADRMVRTAQKIRGAETGWCLGASIAMLDGSNNLCRV